MFYINPANDELLDSCKNYVCCIAYNVTINSICWTTDVKVLHDIYYVYEMSIKRDAFT